MSESKIFELEEGGEQVQNRPCMCAKYKEMILHLSDQLERYKEINELRTKALVFAKESARLLELELTKQSEALKRIEQKVAGLKFMGLF